MTTHAQHTPGPWEVYKRRDAMGQLTGRLPEITGKGGLPIIADIRWNSHNEEHGMANARLIAAAPALLEALERITNAPDLNLDELEPETLNALEQARAAIAQAKGEDHA